MYSVLPLLKPWETLGYFPKGGSSLVGPAMWVSGQGLQHLWPPAPLALSSVIPPDMLCPLLAPPLFGKAQVLTGQSVHQPAQPPSLASVGGRGGVGVELWQEFLR